MPCSFLQRSEHFRQCDAAGSTLDLRLISELRLVKDFAAWRLCYIRAWYRWCAARDLPQFSNEIAGEMDEVKIPGNPKGVAVRTRDPEQGALDELETVALVTKLKEIGPLVLSASERPRCGWRSPLAQIPWPLRCCARRTSNRPRGSERTGSIIC